MVMRGREGLYRKTDVLRVVGGNYGEEVNFVTFIFSSRAFWLLVTETA